MLLEGCLLKPNMVTPGSENKDWNTEEIAYMTVRTLQRTVSCLIWVMGRAVERKVSCQS